MSFPDHFSGQAAGYAQFRPGYPVELFAFLASSSPGGELAWDCGTGNGQAALELAQYFARVVASDASAGQIALAVPHERIEYRVGRAEDAHFAPGSVDLVTVAIAVHWFDLDKFYTTVNQVLKPGGVLAVWTYHLAQIDPAVDQVVLHFYRDVLAGYWPDQIGYVEAGYTTLPFPFDPLPAPGFTMQAVWDLAMLAGFLDSWSAVQRYRQEHEVHPLSMVWDELAQAWGNEEKKRQVRWPLYLKVGRKQ